MPAPRWPAPMSVGAPIRATVLFRWLIGSPHAYGRPVRIRRSPKRLPDRVVAAASAARQAFGQLRRRHRPAEMVALQLIAADAGEIGRASCRERVSCRE